MAPNDSHNQNLPPIDYVEDKFAKDLDPTNGSHLGNTSFTPSCNPLPGPAPAPTLILALVSAPALALPSSNELFKQSMKAYLESN